jgi:hypothetical protein
MPSLLLYERCRRDGGKSGFGRWGSAGDVMSWDDASAPGRLGRKRCASRRGSRTIRHVGLWHDEPRSAAARRADRRRRRQLGIVLQTARLGWAAGTDVVVTGLDQPRLERDPSATSPAAGSTRPATMSPRRCPNATGAASPMRCANAVQTGRSCRGWRSSRSSRSSTPSPRSQPEQLHKRRARGSPLRLASAV